MQERTPASPSSLGWWDNGMHRDEHNGMHRDLLRCEIATAQLDADRKRAAEADALCKAEEESARKKAKEASAANPGGDGFEARRQSQEKEEADSAAQQRAEEEIEAMRQSQEKEEANRAAQQRHSNEPGGSRSSSAGVVAAAQEKEEADRAEHQRIEEKANAEGHAQEREEGERAAQHQVEDAVEARCPTQEEEETKRMAQPRAEERAVTHAAAEHRAMEGEEWWLWWLSRPMVEEDSRGNKKKVMQAAREQEAEKEAEASRKVRGKEEARRTVRHRAEEEAGAVSQAQNKEETERAEQQRVEEEAETRRHAQGKEAEAGALQRPVEKKEVKRAAAQEATAKQQRAEEEANAESHTQEKEEGGRAAQQQVEDAVEVRGHAHEEEEAKRASQQRAEEKKETEGTVTHEATEHSNGSGISHPQPLESGGSGAAILGAEQTCADVEVQAEDSQSTGRGAEVELWCEVPLRGRHIRRQVLSRPGDRPTRVMMRDLCQAALRCLPRPVVRCQVEQVVEPHLHDQEQLLNFTDFFDSVVIPWGCERLVLITQRSTLDEALAMTYLQSLQARCADGGVSFTVLYEVMDLVHQRLVVLATDAGTVALSVEWVLHFHARCRPTVPHSLRPCRRTQVDFYHVLDAPPYSTLVVGSQQGLQQPHRNLRFLRRKLHETAQLEQRLMKGLPLDASQRRAAAQQRAEEEAEAKCQAQEKGDAEEAAQQQQQQRAAEETDVRKLSNGCRG